MSRVTAGFIQLGLTSNPAREPPWLRTVLERLNAEAPTPTVDLARDLNLHPSWLAHAYRSATGEGLQQTLMRKRVERAALLLRSTSDPAAEVAAQAGFCDQSHMIRCFRQVLGRTPSEIRVEAAGRL